jgi:hypothetical protein
METNKKCPSCGAPNDSIFTTCLFCKRPLPQIDKDAVSIETLVSEASKWVGYCYEESLQLKNPRYPNNDDKRIFYNHGEVRGIASQYINLLRIRSLSNPQLTPIVDDLDKNMQKNIKKRSSSIAWAIIGIFVLLIGIVAVGVLLNYYNLL